MLLEVPTQTLVGIVVGLLVIVVIIALVAALIAALIGTTGGVAKTTQRLVKTKEYDKSVQPRSDDDPSPRNDP